MTDGGSYPFTYIGYYDAECRPVRGVVPMEELITLYVNGQPLVSLMCTPTQLEELALGFLFNEGLIEGLDDMAVLELCGGGRCVDVWLEHDIETPQLRVITSGCSGGITFKDVVSAHHQVESDTRVTPQQVTQLMEGLSRAAALYHRAGGIHTAALADGKQLLCLAEDVGRHNALDKLIGALFQSGTDFSTGFVLMTSRCSFELVQKTATVGIGALVSVSAPTALALEIAQKARMFLAAIGDNNVVVFNR